MFNVFVVVVLVSLCACSEARFDSVRRRRVQAEKESVAQSFERGERERGTRRVAEPRSVGTVGKKWQAVFRREATPQHTKVSRAAASSRALCVKIF